MDFYIDTTKQAIDIARNSSSALTSAITAIERLKSMFKTPKPPPMDDVRATITALTEQIIDARDANILLRETIADLREEMIESKRQQEKFAGYELSATPAGHTVYRSSKDIEPVHYLCPACHDAGIKSILQGDQYAKRCRADKDHGIFQFEVSSPSGAPDRVEFLKR
jgi:hypothetical protein